MAGCPAAVTFGSCPGCFSHEVEGGPPGLVANGRPAGGRINAGGFKEGRSGSRKMTIYQQRRRIIDGYELEDASRMGNSSTHYSTML